MIYNFPQFKENLEKLISFKSTFKKGNKTEPFGKENRECLEYFLELGKSMGFSVYNDGNYAGHIEFKGSSDKIIGILGHLDVVPSGDDWDTAPFELTEKDGYFYGRGVSDDKGPVLVLLYVMKKLKDEGILPTATIRLIVGTNEESGWECVKHYFKSQAMPDFGFSPDADFPLVISEKGILRIAFSAKTKFNGIIDGGSSANMVPDLAKAFISGGYSFEKKGISAHGSTPEMGENAIIKLLEKLDKEINLDNTLLNIKDYFADTTGKTIKLDFEDESGALTLNLGILRVMKNKIYGELDIRYPVTMDDKKLMILLKAAMKNFSFKIIEKKEPLMLDENDENVKLLIDAYKEVTKEENVTLKRIGGGTYARTLKHGVAFGFTFDGAKTNIHGKNECAKIDDINKAFDIYYEALKKLAK